MELNDRRTSDRTFVRHIVFNVSWKTLLNSAWKMLFSGKFDARYFFFLFLATLTHQGPNDNLL